MRNLVLQEFLSVDGMAAGPRNSVDFIPAASSGDQSFGRRQSNFLDRAPWGEWDDATIVRTSPSKEVERLKQQPGRDMVIWGSISLAQSLMNDGLIDEYQLIVCPVVVGGGRRLFDEHATPGEMHLLSTRAFDRGTVLLSYSGAMVEAAR